MLHTIPSYMPGSTSMGCLLRLLSSSQAELAAKRMRVAEEKLLSSLSQPLGYTAKGKPLAAILLFR